MCSATRPRPDRRDRGFTLIELLVVVIVVGILSAIAIPVFLNQRKKAVDAGIRADMRQAAIAAETYMASHPELLDGPGTESTHVWNFNLATKKVTGNTISLDDGQTITLSSPDTYLEIYGYNDNVLNTTKQQGYCISAANPRSSLGWVSRASGQPTGATMFWWDSRLGGMTTNAAKPAWC